MHKYYFKIRKGELEFEFSTTEKIAFEEQLSDWIKGAMDSQSPLTEIPVEESNKPERKGFIEVKEMVKINDLNAPDKDMPEEDFENILEDAIENPKVEVEEKTEITSPFLAYLSVFSPKNPTDYLVLTAKYLSENEDLHRFSLKQLNAKLVPATQSPITHNTVQEALENGLITIVPNYTNVADVTEYSLTQSGEGYFIQ